MYPNPPVPPQPPPKQGLSTGAIVAIVLGSVGALIIVVAVVLGMTAARSFKGYVDRSRAIEARVNLDLLRMRAEQFHVEMGRYPEALTPVTAPAPGSCCGKPRGKCEPDRALWQQEPWQSLRFSVDDPHHYAYSYQSDGTGFTARAYGDLDCDGTFSTFEITSTGGATPPVNEPE